jgi:hypothetical protein
MKSDLMPPAPPTFLKRLPWALGQTPIHTVYMYVILSTVGCSWREHEHLTSLTVAGCEYELTTCQQDIQSRSTRLRCPFNSMLDT